MSHQTIAFHSCMLLQSCIGILEQPTKSEQSHTTKEIFAGKCRKQKSRFMSSPVTPFGHRSNKYVLQLAFNKHIMDSIVDERTEPTSEDDVIRRSMPTSTEESVFVVGFVCCDGEGHLNDKSILLEGSVEYCGGQRVRIDLHKLVQFSFFPGQVIGIEGHNPSGHCLVASRVVDSFPLVNPLEIHDQDAPSAKRPALDQTSEKVSLPITPKTISVVIAAGPFTTADNLAFEPLAELLLGSFVDLDHSQIRIGTVDRFFGQIVQEEVCARSRDYCEEVGSGARVVLVPSTRDEQNDFVFPQAPFDINDLEDLNPQVRSNPWRLSLGIMQFGVSSLKFWASDVMSSLQAVIHVPNLCGYNLYGNVLNGLCVSKIDMANNGASV
eukprot:Gb_04482 [translate_table: standard]